MVCKRDKAQISSRSSTPQSSLSVHPPWCFPTPKPLVLTKIHLFHRCIPQSPPQGIYFVLVSNPLLLDRHSFLPFLQQAILCS